jgi:hypothetical protein
MTAHTLPSELPSNQLSLVMLRGSKHVRSLLWRHTQLPG